MLHDLKPNIERTASDAAVRAVLFDLDCTITDRRASVAKAAQLLLKMHPFCGCCTLEKFIAAMWKADHWGYRDRTAFFQEVIDETGWVGHPPMAELLRFWEEDHPTCTTPREEAFSVLAALRARGIRTGIVTNGRVGVQGAKIRQLGLEEKVDAVIISGVRGVHKPDSRIFHHALEQMGTDAEHTLFVGDHPENDIGGAQAVGMRGVWIPCASQFPARLGRPWRTIAGLREIVGFTTGEAVQVLSLQKSPQR